MRTIDDKIAEAQKKLKQLKAQRDIIEARKVQVLIKGERANDTRRKILAGALLLDMMEKDEAIKQQFMERLDTYLTRTDDRALFKLPEIK
jgi:hypothetical protein